MIGNFDDVVVRMRNVGEQLIPYNFPKGDVHLEDELNFVKTKEVIVDGYEIILNFSKSDYTSANPPHFTETLQIIGKNSAFLPFNMVVKLARRFLGNQHLSLLEILKDNRKIYCWTVCLDKRGCPIEQPNEGRSLAMKFEGFEYEYMDPQKVRLM